MKTIILFLFLGLSTLFNQAFSLDTAAVRYYPMAVGNKWTYSYFTNTGPSYRFQEKITGTIVTNGHLYYIFTYYRSGYAPSVSYRRIDSVKNNVLIYSAGSGCSWLQNETTADSLSAKKGDSSLYSCTSYYRTDTVTKTLFGLPRKTKAYNWTNYFEAGLTRELTRDFGFTYLHTFGHTNYTYTSLVGCVINGALFGDTNLVGLNQISTEIPHEYSLSQNYPNPFNPMTKLKFDVMSNVKGQMSNVRLTVFDVLGKLVEVLVDGQLSPGTYEVDFDGSNLPSGVYYYILEAEDFSMTKKMVLIK